jgi:hypothetical protein
LLSVLKEDLFEGDGEMKLKTEISAGFLAIAMVLFCESGVLGNTVKIFYSDGVIQQGESYERVEVYDTPPSHTTVNITGGYVGWPPDVDTGLYTYDASIVNISGGIVDYLHTHNSSTVNISGGWVGSWPGPGERTISSHNSSTINVYEGGFLAGGSSAYFELFDSSTLNVYDGDIDIFFGAFDSTTVNVYGGSFMSFRAAGNSITNIYGGEIGYPWGFDVMPSAAVNIYGYEFVYDPHWFWAEDDLIWGTRWVSRLTGIGFDGTPIEIIDIPDPAMTPNINLIPEPGTILLLALGGLLCAGIAGTKKIRKMTRR